MNSLSHDLLDIENHVNLPGGDIEALKHGAAVVDAFERLLGGLEDVFVPRPKLHLVHTSPDAGANI